MCCFGVNMVSLWFSDGFLMVLLVFSLDFRVYVDNVVSCFGINMFSLWYLYVFLIASLCVL